MADHALIPLIELSRLASKLGEAAFNAQYQFPSLVFSTSPLALEDAPPPSSLGHRSEDETAEFRTTTLLSFTQDPSKKAPNGHPHPHTGVVVALLKKRSTWTPFDDVITVGRAAIQDICLPLPSVSKFHACFTRYPNGWKITDERAKNGTFVNGQRLAPGASVSLTNGATIAFGPQAVAVFHEPAEFLRLVQSSREDL